MKSNRLAVFSMILCAGFGVGAAFGQEPEPSEEPNRRAVSAASSIYVVSAEAGGVNFVEGAVFVTRKAGKSGRLLKTDRLEIGDQVATGADGKAEILLNPGSFVRLGANSNFEFTTTSLDDLQLKLNSGSAMFEVITDSEFSFAVATPKGVFNIVKSGVYRVDVMKDADRIEVWKGRAQIGATEIKGGKQATIDDDATAVTAAKFDRDEKDALELWSKARAKELSKANARLQNAYTRNSLMNSFGGWNLYNSYGLWIFNAQFGSFCFLPFGYGWNSPYGYFYRRDLWHYNLPPWVYTAPPSRVKTPVGGIVRGTTRTNSNKDAAGDIGGAPVRVIPPYVRIQKQATIFTGDVTPDIFGPNNSSPVRMSSPSQTTSTPRIIGGTTSAPGKSGGN